MSLYIIQWNGLYYTGYCDTEGAMWCSVEGAARLLDREEAIRAMDVIQLVMKVPRSSIGLITRNED